MQLKSLVLLGATAAIAVAADPAIKFCAETNSDTNCITKTMDFDVCKWIPDSNAKGDDGSQVSVSSVLLPTVKAEWLPQAQFWQVKRKKAAT